MENILVIDMFAIGIVDREWIRFRLTEKGYKWALSAKDLSTGTFNANYAYVNRYNDNGVSLSNDFFTDSKIVSLEQVPNLITTQLN
jgi:hypothetical protein